MKIGIIGAGRVGCSFAIALTDRGIEVAGVYSKSPESVALINARLKKSFPNDMKWLVENSGVILLTVPDAYISGVAETIASQYDVSGKVFFHCSGALTSCILKPLEEAGAFTGSFHPVQTFADRENSWKSMFGIWFGYEGSDEASVYASKMADVFDGCIINIKPEAKPLYHAAACIISNYTVTLSRVAGMLLEAAGVEKNTGITAFMPLLKNTVGNIGKVGIENALTGPISRGDILTVSGHIEALDVLDKKVSELYKAVGIMTVRLALEKGSIDCDKAEALIKVLYGKI